MKLNKATVASTKVPAGKSETIVFDESLPGFGLRVRAGGKRVWIVQYRAGSKQRRLRLEASKSTIRKEARKALAKARLGEDPQADKIACRTAKPREMTLGGLVEQYLPHRLISLGDRRGPC
jgi:hypothetical protein